MIKSDFATVTFREMEFQIPPRQRGEVTTVEGLLRTAAGKLGEAQDLRMERSPEVTIREAVGGGGEGRGVAGVGVRYGRQRKRGRKRRNMLRERGGRGGLFSNVCVLLLCAVCDLLTRYAVSGSSGGVWWEKPKAFAWCLFVEGKQDL